MIHRHLLPFASHSLSAHQLLPVLCSLIEHEIIQDNDSLSQKQPPYQPCWLKNQQQDIIGLFPKVSWTVYAHSSPASQHTPTHTYHIIEHHRHLHDAPSSPLQLHTANPFKNAIYHTAIYHTQATHQWTYQQWCQHLIQYCQQHDVPHTNPSHINPNTDNHAVNETSFKHGLMGFIGYDIAAQEMTDICVNTPSSQPAAYLAHYDCYLQQADGLWYFCYVTHTLDNEPLYKQLLDWLINISQDIIHTIDQNLNSSSIQTSAQSAELTPYWQPNDYQTAFLRTQAYLHAGDCYQINLTQCWRGQLSTQETLLQHLPNLYQATQAPFAGYLKVSDFELLSCSPELFFTFLSHQHNHQKIHQKTHHIITKPIKGTRPRHVQPEQDQQLKNELINSEKDQAENLMIVDLLRNDLGKYAKIGSVRVPKLFDIESFRTVHHMVSTITAELKTDTHPLQVLFDSLPAGSITGTPKKRAIEIIAELEAQPRGAYCGTMGFLNFDGTGQWNVLIRTLQANQTGQVSLWAGGGITVASNCESEYQECWDKAQALIDGLNH